MQLRQLLRDADRETRLLLLVAGVLLALTMTCASRAFAARFLGLPPGDPACVLWHYGATFLLLGVAPAALWGVLLRRPLSGLGLCAGDVAFAARLAVVALPLLAGAAWLSSSDPAIRAEYPLADVAAGDLRTFVLVEAGYLLYYVGWEVFYRGWLVLALARPLGAFPAVGLSMLVSTAVHYGKPGGEVWGAAVAGILLGWYVLRTRSIAGAVLFHATVGVLVDVFVWTSGGGRG